MKCPHCNQNFNESEDFDFELKTDEAWEAGSRAALTDSRMTRKNCRSKCPFDPHKEMVLFNFWCGGAYAAMCWRHEQPDEVEEWLSKHGLQDETIKA